MRVFKTRELAVRAACEMMVDQGNQQLEVGPMLAEPEGNVFKGEELRRICGSGRT
jgi:hypothetical protein